MKYYFILTAVSLGCLVNGYSQPGNSPFANRYLSNLRSPTAVNVHLLPWKANEINLGSTSKNWKNLYLNGNVYKGSDRFLSSDALGNTFLGILAGRINTGSHNTAIGDSTMYSNTTGNENTATGYQALYSNTTGQFNNGFGNQALYSNTDGEANNAHGWRALYINNGFGNDAFGGATLRSNTTGFFNMASGLAALANNTEGFSNVASGAFALVQNATGIFNTAIGVGAIEGNTTNSFNTAIGGEAGGLSLNFSNATFIGAQTNTDPGLTNITAVGYQARTTASNQVTVGNTAVTSIGGYANWSNFSDGRYKKNVQGDVPGLAFITQLRPVTYTLDVDGIENAKNANMQKASAISIPGLNDKISYYAGAMKKAEKQHSPEELKAKQEKAKVVYTGFIAQEVEDAAKKLHYNFSGVDAPKTGKSFYALRYGDFVVPLVKAVQEQQKQIDEQQKQIAELKALIQSITKQSLPGTTNFSTAFIKQNAPNPFSRSSVISYYIPESINNAQIMVTDMMGRLVRTFTALKGEGQINISSGELTAATYNYTLLANGKKIDTKQMVITR